MCSVRVHMSTHVCMCLSLSLSVCMGGGVGYICLTANIFHKCCALGIKCSLQVHMFEYLVPGSVPSTVWAGSGTLRRWGLAGGGESWGVCRLMGCSPAFLLAQSLLSGPDMSNLFPDSSTMDEHHVFLIIIDCILLNEELK